MHRATPVTYIVSALLSAGVASVDIVCAANEIVQFDPPRGQDCISYLSVYINRAGARLLNPQASDGCQICPVANTDAILAGLGIYSQHRWRDFAISLVYSVVNILLALLLYWLFRAPKAFARQKT